VKDAKPVRIWLGPQFKPTKGDFEPLTELGFLTDDRGAEFQIVSGDGVPEIYAKHGEKPGDPGFVGYREVSLSEQLELLLSKLETPDESDVWGRLYAGNRAGLRRSCRLFMLARWAAQRGNSSLGLEALQALQSWRTAHKTEGQPESLEAQLQQELVTSLRERALQSLSQSGVSRAAVLETLQRLIQVCPRADLKEEKSAVDTLTRMVRDDAAHQPLTDEQLAALPPERRAEELVFRLRDENRKARRIGADEEKIASARAPWPSNGAAIALEELGLAAAPALAKALDDDSFTRERTPKNLVRTRDIAMAELAALAGCNFSSVRWTTQDSGDFTTEQREAARAWWKGVSEKGEKDYLIDCIRSRSGFSKQYGKRLLERYADDAFPVIIEAARSGPKWEDRAPMYELLMNENDPRCVAFFDDQLAHAPELFDRLVAAIVFRIRGDSRGSVAMRAEWPRLAANFAQTKWPEVTDRDPLDVPSNLITFLATAAAPETILSLAAPNPNIPPEWRARIIEKLTSAANGSTTSEFREAANPATKVALEDALVEFLGDASRLERTTSSRTWFFDDFPLAEPRVCDIAAVALRSWKPEKYAFDHWRSPAARTRQCIVCANVRAKESGEPLQPVPPEPEPQPSSVENSNKVVAIEGNAPPKGEAAEFAAKLATFRDAPLDGMALSSALAALAAKPLPDHCGFTLAIFRCSDAPGISLRTNFDAGDSVDSSGNVVVYGALQSADTSTLEVYGEGARPQWVDPAKWEPLRKALDKALAAPANTGFLIIVEFTTDASQE
jgi:hypothetical protein